MFEGEVGGVVIHSSSKKVGGGWVGGWERTYWSAKVIAKAKSFWACLREVGGVVWSFIHT